MKIIDKTQSKKRISIKEMNIGEIYKIRTNLNSFKEDTVLVLAHGTPYYFEDFLNDDIDFENIIWLYSIVNSEVYCSDGLEIREAIPLKSTITICYKED